MNGAQGSLMDGAHLETNLITDTEVDRAIFKQKQEKEQRIKNRNTK